MYTLWYTHGQVHETYHDTKGVGRLLQAIYEQVYSSKLINLTRLKQSQHTNYARPVIKFHFSMSDNVSATSIYFFKQRTAKYK